MPDFRTTVDAILRLPDSGARAVEFNNLGIRLAQVGQYQEAIEAFRSALEYQPTLVAALRNFAEAVHLKGETQLAIKILERYCETADPDPTILSKLERLRETVGGASENSLRESLRLTPAQPDKAYQLACKLEANGDPREAAQWYAHTLRLEPKHFGANAHQLLRLPQIPQSTGDIAASREALRVAIETLAQAEPNAPATAQEKLFALSIPNHYLHYQGGDDTALQRSYARLIEQIVEREFPDLCKPRQLNAAGTRIRVGFYSDHFCNHPVGHYYGAWVRRLDPTRFEVHAFHRSAQSDAVTQSIRERSVFHDLRGHQNVASVLQTADLDVLIYVDGVDSVSLPLMAARLAPIQVSAAGMPVTTGFKNIDYFLSNEACEPERAQAHYIESLHCLPGLGLHLAAKHLPEPVTRAELGLPAEGLLLLCPQAPYKVHPDMDALFARILEALPDAHLVMMRSRFAKYDELLAQRLKNHSPILAARIIRLENTHYERFLQINVACDLALDTLHFSGGATSLDAIACGLPIVTLPSAFLRGRQTFGMYREMGLEQWAARDPDEYVARAVEWGRDATLRVGLRRNLLERSAKLFEDTRPIRALETWIEATVNKHRA